MSPTSTDRIERKIRLRGTRSRVWHIEGQRDEALRRLKAALEGETWSAAARRRER